MANTKKRKANSAPKLSTVEMSSSDFSPLVFISHDTRDADIAEAFSKLLSDVTAGVLKSFRSSDKSGTQGIEYGAEWFPNLMEKLQCSTDVVCILSEYSVDRPWILFEAGVAKGKLSKTPMLGLAVGIPLSKANTGPFAQFQNCDDDTEAITKLVFQLVKRIPRSEPDSAVIKPHVEKFKKRVDDIIKERGKPKKGTVEKVITSDESTAKVFEEIKIMFNRLSELFYPLADRVRRIDATVDGLSQELRIPRRGMDQDVIGKDIPIEPKIIADQRKATREVFDYVQNVIPKEAAVVSISTAIKNDPDLRILVEIQYTGDLTQQDMNSIAKKLMGRNIYPKFIKKPPQSIS